METFESNIELEEITALLKDLPETERAKFYYMLIGARMSEGYAKITGDQREAS